MLTGLKIRNGFIEEDLTAAVATELHRGKKKCEDCQLKMPSFGLPAHGKKRWCGGCAKAHAGVVKANNKKCEDCQLKRPSFGLMAEGKKRWRSGGEK